MNRGKLDRHPCRAAVESNVTGAGRKTSPPRLVCLCKLFSIVESMIRVKPYWCDATSVYSEPERVDVDACITYLVSRGWLKESGSTATDWALVFEGCGVADAECRMVRRMLDRGFSPAAIVFLDKRLSTATIENVRNLPAQAHIGTRNQILLAPSYANLNEFLRAWTGNVLVLGVHADWRFTTQAEEQSYNAFCELCMHAAAKGTAQTECVNFHGKPDHPFHMPDCHPIDGTDTWVYHEPWQMRVDRNSAQKVAPAPPTRRVWFG